MIHLRRRLSDSQRTEVLTERQKIYRPWRRPPHFDQGNTFYHLTAACYEHRDWIGHSPQRMENFCQALLDVFENHSSSESPAAWCVLPNHYHVLARTTDLKSLLTALAKLHGALHFNGTKRKNPRVGKFGTDSRIAR